MTDNLEQAGAAVDTVAAEAKPEVKGIIAHLEAYGVWTEAEIAKAKAWLENLKWSE